MEVFDVGKLIDLTGERYGRWTVVRRAEKKCGRDTTYWLCKCDCGAERIVSGATLRRGESKSCGCLQRELASKQFTVDMVGQIHGRLIVIERYGHDGFGNITWLCRCDCGNEKVIAGASLRSGNTRSCGCLQKERASEVHSLPEGVAAFNDLLSKMQHGAESRGYEWQLTDEQVARLTKQPCHYCGVAPAQIHGGTKYNGDYIYNGIDRVNNKGGYMIDNVVSCCFKCNRMKSAMTLEEFRSQVLSIYGHLLVRGE